MRRLAFVSVLAAACGSSPTSTTQPHYITVNSTVQDFFGVPDANGNPPALTAAESQCPSLQAQVAIYPALPLILSPATAKPLTTCNASPSDGTFSCTQLDINNASEAMYAVISDTSSANCLTPMVMPYITCGTRDFTTAGSSCAAAIADNILDASDMASGALLNAFAMPSTVMDAFVQGVAASDAASPPSVTYKALTETGILLQTVTTPSGAPLVGALPVLPSECTGDEHCRAFVVDEDTSGIQVFAEDGTQVTSETGLWFAQVQDEDTSGNLTQLALNASADTDVPDSYGSIDCSGANECLQSLPSIPFISGTLGGLPGAVSLNYIAQDNPATSADQTQCPYYKGVVGTLGAAALTCPAR